MSIAVIGAGFYGSYIALKLADKGHKEILKDILKNDDLLICLSTSGKSKNILKAFEYSKDICKSVLITGNKTEISDFVIDSGDTQILEDCFGAIFHCICKW